MGFASRGITGANILDAIVDDSTRFSGADIAAILTDTASTDNRRYFFIEDVFGDPIAPFLIGSSLSDDALSSVAIPGFVGRGVSMYEAYPIIRIASIEDTSGADNHLNITSQIQVDRAAAGWLNCIDIPNNSLQVSADSRNACGAQFIGETNIIAKVVSGQTTDFQWYQSRALGGDLIIGGCQMGIRLVCYT